MGPREHELHAKCEVTGDLCRVAKIHAASLQRIPDPCGVEAAQKGRLGLEPCDRRVTDTPGRKFVGLVGDPVAVVVGGSREPRRWGRRCVRALEAKPAAGGVGERGAAFDVVEQDILGIDALAALRGVDGGQKLAIVCA